MKRLSGLLLVVAVLMCLLLCDGFEARKMGDIGKVFMNQNGEHVEGRALVQSVPSPGVGH